jgi:heat shock protein HslJ
MDEDAEPVTEPVASPAEDPDPEPAKPAPMGRNFYLVMALIGVMVFLIIFFNVPATRASAATALVTYNWTLVSYAGTTGVLGPVMNGTHITADFGTDGTVSGSAGCNRYAAIYKVKEYALSITTPSSTEMYCPAPGVMEQETLYLSNLGNVQSIRVYEPDLNMYDATGRMILVFRPDLA